MFPVFPTTAHREMCVLRRHALGRGFKDQEETSDVPFVNGSGANANVYRLPKLSLILEVRHLLVDYA